MRIVYYIKDSNTYYRLKESFCLEIRFRGDSTEWIRASQGITYNYYTEENNYSLVCTDEFVLGAYRVIDILKSYDD